ncbi:MAG: tol-pal system protein YbgF [Magnetococcales bacterium]|nr:tol-pal system protein YbgF [Magnetococcales bacterium]
MAEYHPWNMSWPFSEGFFPRLSLVSLLLLAGCGAPPPAAGPAPIRTEEISQEAPPPLDKEVKRLTKTVTELSRSAENNRVGSTEMLKRFELMEKELNTLRGDLEVARHTNRQLLEQVASLNQRPVQPSLPATMQPAAMQPATGVEIEPGAVVSATDPASAPPHPVTTAAAPAPAKTETAKPVAVQAVPPAAASSTAAQLVAARLPAAASPKISGQKPASADQAYKEAFLNLRSGQYTLAGTGFRNFLKWFPEDEKAPKAQYWIGETHYVQRQFREALQEFNQVLMRWPKNDIVPACLLKMGFSLYELEEWAKSRDILNRLIKEFPGSPTLNDARKRLKMIDTQLKGQPPQGKKEGT